MNTDPQSTSLLQKLKLAERAETVFAEMYHILADQFHDDTTYSPLFRRLEREELQHGMRIQMLRKRYMNSSKGMMLTNDLDPLPLMEFIEKGEDIKASLEKERLHGSAEEASEFMAELEEKFAGIHAEMIVSTQDPELKHFFENMAKQDNAHKALLTTSKI